MAPSLTLRVRRRWDNIGNMKPSQATPRAGLAPLELVLVLPILLFVMALMMNLGTGGAWKLRTQINARHAAWRSLEQRTGNNDPHPGNWPSDATLDSGPTSPSAIPFDPYAGETVVRGPVLVEPVAGEWLPVRPDYLDMRPQMLGGDGGDFASRIRCSNACREIWPLPEIM